MKKFILLLVGYFLFWAISFGQPLKNKNLFVIDSVPVITDPEEWNEVLQEDISDTRVLNNKDSLTLLGFKKFESVTYIFTKEYRNRPDSIKRIPSLKQMEIKDDAWTYFGIPYNGKYIDYYNNGKKQNEGFLIDGRLNGELKIYYKTGSLSKQSFYTNGYKNGDETEYYKSGVVKGKRTYKKDNPVIMRHYFPNGQLEYGNFNEKFDTAVSYYSNGKIKQVDIFKNGEAVKTPVTNNIIFFQNKVYDCARTGDIKNGLKYCDKIIKLNSTNETAYFFKGEFLIKLNLFDEAIAAYSKALKIEPLSKYALISRAFARIKKFESLDNNRIPTSTGTKKEFIPLSETELVCADLQQAVFCDADEKRITEAILKYCPEKSKR